MFNMLLEQAVRIAFNYFILITLRGCASKTHSNRVKKIMNQLEKLAFEIKHSMIERNEITGTIYHVDDSRIFEDCVSELYVVLWNEYIHNNISFLDNKLVYTGIDGVGNKETKSRINSTLKQYLYSWNKDVINDKLYITNEDGDTIPVTDTEYFVNNFMNVVDDEYNND